ASFHPGARIGRYILLDEVGRGAMGIVYAAYDPDLDRKIALKLIAPTHAGNQRLLREAKAMARVACPNVVTVYDTGVFGEHVVVAMELMDALTLTEWLRSRRYRWREIVQVFEQAGRGLEAAHRAGVVHRDFKPDNVLVARSGRVCVTDFGLARPLAETEP